MHRLFLLVLLGSACACAQGPPSMAEVGEAYLEQYFEMYPSRATLMGRSDHDARLELPTEERILQWVRYQDDADAAMQAALARPDVSDDDRIDAEVLRRQTARERHEYVVLRRYETDPLYWTRLAAGAVRFHIVRERRPAEDRVADAIARARQIPALVAEATRRIETAPGDRLAAEVCRVAAGQAQASAAFYRSNFLTFTSAGGAEAQDVADQAATSLATLGNLLYAASLRASGPVGLGRHYAQTLRVELGVDQAPDELLTMGQQDLANVRQEAAAYGRSVWRDVMPGRPMPGTDSAVLRALFDRLAEDRDSDVGTYTRHWQAVLAEADAFASSQQMLRLPDAPPPVVIASPSYTISQSVGELVPPGPYDPGAPSVLFLPVPRPDATLPLQTAFYRDFNRHFVRMFAPHLLVPGHDAQARHAARHPRKLRMVFADQLYVEGWGTFSERLMLDLGWGGPLVRLAHLKRRIENVARLIVDIQVQTSDISRDEIMRFVRQEALQEEQFAGNMWTRAVSASPEMVAYHLGYREVRDVHDAARRAGDGAVDPRTFAEQMMALGPVAIRHYRERIAPQTRTSRPPGQS